jgi:hypothetical protein
MDLVPPDYHCLVFDKSGVPETVIRLLVNNDSTAVVVGCELSRTFPDYSCIEIRGRGKLLYAQWRTGELLERMPPRAPKERARA